MIKMGAMLFDCSTVEEGTMLFSLCYSIEFIMDIETI